MAKKKTAKKKPQQRDKGKTRFEVRFDDDVVEQLRSLAEKAQISVNQLLHGLARWAVQDPMLGDPIKDENGFITEQRRDQQQPGAIWWGKRGQYRIMDEEDAAAFEQHYGHSPDPGQETVRDLNHKGDVYVRLDFTERRVVRED